METFIRATRALKWSSDKPVSINLAKFACLTSCLIEVTSIIFEVVKCLTGQLELGIVSAAVAFLSLLAGALVVWQPRLLNFKIYFGVATLGILQTIVSLPFMFQWLEASELLCNGIADYDSLPQECVDLTFARRGLTSLLIIGLIQRTAAFVFVFKAYLKAKQLKAEYLAMNAERIRRRDEMLRIRAARERKIKELKRRDLKAVIQKLEKSGPLSENIHLIYKQQT